MKLTQKWLHSNKWFCEPKITKIGLFFFFLNQGVITFLKHGADSVKMYQRKNMISSSKVFLSESHRWRWDRQTDIQSTDCSAWTTSGLLKNAQNNDATSTYTFTTTKHETILNELIDTAENALNLFWAAVEYTGTHVISQQAAACWFHPTNRTTNVPSQSTSTQSSVITIKCIPV